MSPMKAGRMRICLRHGVKWRRLAAVVSLLVLSFMFVAWIDDDEDVSSKIFKAVHPSTESVTLPNEDTVLVQPWKSKSCQNSGSNQYLLFMIVSSPENFENRKVIREIIRTELLQWEKMVIEEFPESQHKMHSTIKALFFIGQPSNASNELMDEKLYSEAKTNGDIVHDNFIESYLNLTVKTLRMLKWVGVHCKNVRYLVKLDDDVYLNVPALLGFLREIVIPQKSENLIAGFKYKNIKIDSSPSSKWYTPHTLWDMERFPDFVSGICYVLGSRARKDIYTHALTTPLFHLEDVFLTGIVRDKYLTLGVVNIPGMHVDWSLNSKIYTFPCGFLQNVVAVHSLSPGQVGCYSKMQGYCENKLLSWIPVLLLCY